MSEIRVNLLSSRLLLYLKNCEAQCQDIIKKRMMRATLKLAAYIKEQKLSGQKLNVRSGTLRRSIHNVVSTQGGNVIGVVGTNIRYARVHEFGFTGSVNVKSYIRNTKKGNAVNVRSHSRFMNLPMRSFLREGLHDRRDDIIREFDAGVKEILKLAKV